MDLPVIISTNKETWVERINSCFKGKDGRVVLTRDLERNLDNFEALINREKEIRFGAVRYGQTDPDMEQGLLLIQAYREQIEQIKDSLCGC